MNVLLILNERAGSVNGDKDAVTASAVQEAFRTAGMNVQPRTTPSAKLCETLQDAVAAKPDVIVIGGGDGSVSAAAHLLADTPIALGVLPLGTLNHFAHDLGLPANWRDAVTALAHGKCRSVDLGEVNGRTFINNCSIGSYAEAVRKRDALRRWRGLGKWWAMTLATIAVFRRLRRLRLSIEAKGKTTPLRAPFVVVANNRYSGRVLDHSMRPQLDEGRLWIYTTRAGRHGDILRFAWQSLLREIDRVDGLEKIGVTEAIIRHDYGRLPIALDGELVDLSSPLRLRIRRGALRVLAPRTGQEPEPPGPVPAIAGAASALRA